MPVALAPQPTTEPADADLVDVADAGSLTDDELTAQALAADPDAPLPADAVSLWDVDDGAGAHDPGLLPGWYMPVTGTGPRRVRSWKKRAVLWTVIVALLLINAAGLCVTYGRITIA